ncbi:unnamed protein product [Sphagnum balticum]
MFLINGFCWGTWAGRLNAFQEHFGVGTALLSAAILSAGIGAICAMPLTGRLCDRFGSRPIIAVSGVLMCCSLGALGLVSTFLLFALSLFLLGFASGMNDVSMNAHAVLVERRYRKKIMSSFHGFFSCGAMGGAFGCSLASASGAAPSSQLPVVAVVLLLLTVTTHRRLLAADQDQNKSFEQSKGSPELGKIETVVLALSVIALCSFVSEGAMGDWIAIYFHTVIRTTESYAALAFAAFNVAMTIGRFMGDSIADRFGPANIVRGGALLAVLGLSCALLFNHPYASIVGVVFVGLGLSSIVPNVFSAAGLVSNSPGRSIATVALMGYGGILLGPPVIGLTASLIGLRGALALVCILEALVVVLADFLNRPRKQNYAARPENENLAVPNLPP